MLLFYYVFSWTLALRLLLFLLAGLSLYLPSAIYQRKAHLIDCIKGQKATTLKSSSTASLATTQATPTTTTASTTQTTTQPTTTTIAPVLASCTFNKPNCGTCFNLTTTGGVVQSPNYPNDYGNYLNCLTTINVTPGKTIELTFTTFIVESCCDVVSILEGPKNTLKATFAGYANPPPITSTGNQMTIQFTSDVDNSLLLPVSLRPGRWRATFRVV